MNFLKLNFSGKGFTFYTISKMIITSITYISLKTYTTLYAIYQNTCPPPPPAPFIWSSHVSCIIIGWEGLLGLIDDWAQGEA